MGIVAYVISEIAVLLGVSVFVVRNYLQRAERKERNELLRQAAIIQAIEAQALADESETRDQQERSTPEGRHEQKRASD